MNIETLLNSGALHAKARAKHPERVDAQGNIHASKARAQFVDWRRSMELVHGCQARDWPDDARAELERRYVPSKA